MPRRGCFTAASAWVHCATFLLKWSWAGWVLCPWANSFSGNKTKQKKPETSANKFISVLLTMKEVVLIATPFEISGYGLQPWCCWEEGHGPANNLNPAHPLPLGQGQQACGRPCRRGRSSFSGMPFCASLGRQGQCHGSPLQFCQCWVTWGPESHFHARRRRPQTQRSAAHTGSPPRRAAHTGPECGELGCRHPCRGVRRRRQVQQPREVGAALLV